MTARYNIFPIETRLDELFDTLYPEVKAAPGVHPAGRAYKPILDSATAVCPIASQCEFRHCGCHH